MKKPIIGVTLDRNEGCPEGKLYSKHPWYAVRENYCTALHELGCIPLPLPHFPDEAAIYAHMIDGLVITGGDFDIDPAFYNADTCHKTIKVKACRTAFELAIAKEILAQNKPILGICGGEQLINVALGGTLVQHIPDEIENAIPHSTGAALSHDIRIENDTQLFKIAGREQIRVNSSHHQSIKDLGQGLIVNARAEDGVIEGIEAPDHKFCLGVQWHPEYFNTPTDKAIYQAFIAATAK